VRKIYAHVPVLDSGARGSTLTFAQNGQGDVLLAWENDAHLAIKEFGADKVEIVIPSESILAEPPVAIVDKVVDKRGTRALALAYLNYLYTDEAQDIIGKNFYRPISEAAQKKYADQFPTLKLATIADFGGWRKAQAQHFDDGGTFDQIYVPSAKPAAAAATK
jgi:sulfate transport system substrate-binding protein